MKNQKSEDTSNQIRARHVQRVLHLRPSKHTGHRLPSSQTSFGALFILLLLLVPQLIIYRGVNGVQTASGSVQVTARVPGPAPTTPATITSPSSGTSATATITVSGTCGPDLLVRIFRNDVFAGSTYCSSGGTFSLPITLYTGQNDLRALNYDTLDQPGPTSATVSISYQPKTTTTSTPSNKLPVNINVLLEIDYHLRQLEPNKAAIWQAKITYGRPAYALSIDWGDNTHENRQVTDSNTFDITHAYQNAGKYIITFKVIDTDGNTTGLQVAVTVNGTPVVIQPVVTTAKSDCGNTTTGSSLAGCSITRSHWSFLVPIFWILLIIMGTLWFVAELKHRKHHHDNPQAHPSW